MGYVVIDAERCKGCELCIDSCNRDALAPASAVNSKGYMPPELVRRDRCTGCALCAIVCPDLAITVYK